MENKKNLTNLMVPHPPGDTGGGYKFSPGNRLQETEHNKMGWTNMVKRRDKLNQYPWAEVICSRPDYLMQV